MNYVGQIIMAHAPPDGYGTGEYFVLSQTDESLAAVSTCGGFHSTTVRYIPLTGEKAWKIADARKNGIHMQRFAERLRHYGEHPATDNGRRQYVQEVYEHAIAMADTIDRVLGEQRQYVRDIGKPETSLQEPLIINIPKGKAFTINVE